MSNAFASILQARPFPAFGRPVHLWDSPLDYGPVLLLMPFGFHLTVDSLPSEELQTAAQLTLQIPVDFPRCSNFIAPIHANTMSRPQRTISLPIPSMVIGSTTVPTLVNCN